MLLTDPSLLTRIVLNQISTTLSDGQIIAVDLTWIEPKKNLICNETEVNLDITAEEWINILGKKYDMDESYYSQCCIKTVGEASFLLGNYRLREYAFINENVIPKLIVLAKDAIGK